MTWERSAERYKLAQLFAQVMDLKASERAYLMPHCAWFYKKTAEGEWMEANAQVDLGEKILKYYKEASRQENRE